MNEQKQGIVVTFGNFKGGSGKTTTSTMIAYALSEMGYKVLLSDQGPVADATRLYSKTKLAITGEEMNFDKTLMRAIIDNDLQSIVTEIKENLYLLPSGIDFCRYPEFLEEKFPNTVDRIQYLSKLIEPLKKEFDFIFIDSPPQNSIINDSAFYASDYVVVVLQTQKFSLQAAESMREHLQFLKDEYGAKLDIIGILPVLLEKGSHIDLEILADAKRTYGEENFFNIEVKSMERLKRFDITGITDKDMHDRIVHEVYKNIAVEFITRLNAENVEVEDKVTSVRMKSSCRDKLNNLVLLNKAETVGDLLDFMIEKYLDEYVTEDEKKKFDLLMELCKQKKIDQSCKVFI